MPPRARHASSDAFSHTGAADINANESPRSARATGPAAMAEGVPMSAYATAVALWWREILALSATAALLGIAGVWSLGQLVPRYAASADVAIIHTSSSVALDERFQAVDRSELQIQRRGRPARRAALVGLVHQADLAERVFDRLQSDLEEGASPVELLSAIDAELVTVGMAGNRPESDLIRLTAYASGAPLAKALADAWAEAFVEDMNALFADVPRQVVDTVAAELASVRARYADAEAELQAFMAASRIDLLEQEIAAKDAVIEEVVSTWRLTATAAFQKEMTSRLAAIDEDLAHLRQTRARLRDAQGLRLLLDSSPSSVATNSLALYLFKARLTAEDAHLEIRLGDMPAVSAADQQRDVDTTIKSLERQILDLDASVADQTDALASLVGDSDEEGGIRNLLRRMVQQLDTNREQPMMELLAKLENEKRALTSERQNELIAQANLTVARDLMHTTLSTLQSEVVELELSLASAPSQVRLASLAVLPVDTAWPGAPLVGAVCLVAGFLAALLLVPLASAMGWRPPLGRRR